MKSYNVKDYDLRKLEFKLGSSILGTNKFWLLVL